MTLFLKATSFSARLLLPQSVVQRLPLVPFEQKRTASFTQGRQRMGKPKGRKPQPVDKTEPLTTAMLYQNEIGKEIFEARAKDLPDENMENPFVHKKRLCLLCKHNISPDYKNVKLLSQFISRHTGRIFGRHITGLCRDQQARVEKEIRKSRTAGFMAYYFKSPEFFDDPKICDPTRPTRPHPY